MHYIYILRNKVNDKIYVGQTNNLKKRFIEHKAKDRLRTKGTPLYCAIHKYGFYNFEMIEIESHENYIDSDDAEEFWIQLFQSRNREIGYNLSIGGRVNRGFKHSDEFKKNKSEQMKNTSNQIDRTIMAKKLPSNSKINYQRCGAAKKH